MGIKSHHFPSLLKDGISIRITSFGVDLDQRDRFRTKGFYECSRFYEDEN